MAIRSETQNRYLVRRILVLSFIAAMVFVVAQTLTSIRDVNDTWILEGVLPSFVFLTFVYVVIISYSEDLKIIATFTSLYVGILNLIPQLKYAFVYGYYDPLPHLGFLTELVNSGNVPQLGSYGIQYGSTPGSHLTMAGLSIICGMTPVWAMKTFLSISPFLIPLTVYFVVKRLPIPQPLSKCIIAATVFTSPTLYRFVGTIGVYSLYLVFISLALLIVFNGTKSRADFVLFSFLGLGVILSHDVTSLFVVACLAFIVLAHRLRKQSNHGAISSERLVIIFSVFVLADLAHLSLVSGANFFTVLDLIKNSLRSIFSGKAPGAAQYYSGFYQLNVIQQLQVTVVRIGRDAACVILVALAPLALFRLKSDKSTRTFYYFVAVPAAVALATFVLPLFIRSYIINRGLIYLSAFAPFLAGLTLFWIVYSRRFSFRKILFALSLFLLIFVSVAELYPCQPIVPTIKIGNESFYVMDLRAATTIYDMSAISFINSHDLNLTVVTDGVFQSQIQALSNSTFQSLVTLDNSALQPFTRTELELVSLAGNTHIIISGRDAIANEQKISNLTQEYSILYSNGKAFTLLMQGS